MNKKILIASLFATLMLTVPMTSVIGISEVDDCGYEVVSSLNLVRVERLLARLEVYFNIILLRFGHISGVREKCREILEIINLDPDDPICIIINTLLELIISFIFMFPEEVWWLISAPFMPILMLLFVYGIELGCGHPL